MDWLSGNFCEEFASSSSITDIVDFVENSGSFENSEPSSSALVSFGNGLISVTNNQLSNEQGLPVTTGPGPAPLEVDEPAQVVADTTADSNYVSSQTKAMFMCTICTPHVFLHPGCKFATGEYFWPCEWCF